MSPTGGGNTSILTLLVQKVVEFFGTSPEADALSPELRLLVSTVDDSSRFVGQRVLGSVSCDDLDARIGHVLESPQLAEWLNRIAEALARGGLTELLEETPNDAAVAGLISVLGDGQQALIAEADRLLRIVHSAIAQIVTGTEQLARAGIPVSLSAKPFDALDPLAFLSDPDVPPLIGSAILSVLRSDVLILAIVDARRAESKLEPWLSRALAERLVSSLKQYVALVASVPLVKLSLDDVPLDQRLDVAAIEAEHRQTNAAIEALMRKADASGEDVYVPERDS